MTSNAPHLFCFGLGYCARAIGRELLPAGWTVSGTVRSEERQEQTRDEGFHTHIFDPQNDVPLPQDSLFGVTHILISAPPGEDGDLIVKSARNLLHTNKERIQWIGYFSTTGVYGDHDGGWVDENTPVNPASARGRRRVQAEQDWQDVASEMGVPLNIFRLPGIYGPGRNALISLKQGKARRIVKTAQVFGRVHVDDIVQTVLAAITLGESGVYNVVDDETSPPQDVITYAASLLDMEPPPEIEFERADLSPMAKSFYGENKRVRNDLIKEKLGIKLKYPDYRSGLKALFDTLP